MPATSFPCVHMWQTAPPWGGFPAERCGSPPAPLFNLANFRDPSRLSQNVRVSGRLLLGPALGPITVLHLIAPFILCLGHFSYFENIQSMMRAVAIYYSQLSNHWPADHLLCSMCPVSYFLVEWLQLGVYYYVFTSYLLFLFQNHRVFIAVFLLSIYSW